MKIRYTKKKLRVGLILGLVWLILGLIQVISSDFTEKTDYFFILMALAYLGMYLYEYFSQYLTIDNRMIKVNSLFGKKINLSEIKEFKKFAGDYILKSDKTELTINTQIIDPNSLIELDAELNKLNI